MRSRQSALAFLRRENKRLRAENERLKRFEPLLDTLQRLNYVLDEKLKLQSNDPTVYNLSYGSSAIQNGICKQCQRSTVATTNGSRMEEKRVNKAHQETQTVAISNEVASVGERHVAKGPTFAYNNVYRENGIGRRAGSHFNTTTNLSPESSLTSSENSRIINGDLQGSVSGNSSEVYTENAKGVGHLSSNMHHNPQSDEQALPINDETINEVLREGITNELNYQLNPCFEEINHAVEYEQQQMQQPPVSVQNNYGGHYYYDRHHSQAHIQPSDMPHHYHHTSAVQNSFSHCQNYSTQSNFQRPLPPHYSHSPECVQMPHQVEMASYPPSNTEPHRFEPLLQQHPRHLEMPALAPNYQESQPLMMLHAQEHSQHYSLSLQSQNYRNLEYSESQRPGSVTSLHMHQQETQSMSSPISHSSCQPRPQTPGHPLSPPHLQPQFPQPPVSQPPLANLPSPPPLHPYRPQPAQAGVVRRLELQPQPHVQQKVNDYQHTSERCSSQMQNQNSLVFARKSSVSDLSSSSSFSESKSNLTAEAMKKFIEKSPTEVFAVKSKPKPLEQDNSGQSRSCSKYFEINMRKLESNKRNLIEKQKVTRIKDRPKKKRESNNSKNTSRSKNSKLNQDVGKRKPIPCTWKGCERSFSNNQTLRFHLMRHEGNFRFLCDHPNCNYKAVFKSHLLQHKLTHSDARPFSCEWPGCDRSFKTRGTLDGHRAIHEAQLNDSTYTCDIPDCEFTCKNLNHLMEHRRNFHSQHKPYSCNWPGCKHSFKSVGILRYHMRKHQNKKEKGTRRMTKKSKALTSTFEPPPVRVKSQSSDIKSLVPPPVRVKSESNIHALKPLPKADNSSNISSKRSRSLKIEKPTEYVQNKKSRSEQQKVDDKPFKCTWPGCVSGRL